MGSGATSGIAKACGTSSEAEIGAALTGVDVHDLQKLIRAGQAALAKVAEQAAKETMKEDGGSVSTAKEQAARETKKEEGGSVTTDKEQAPKGTKEEDGSVTMASKKVAKGTTKEEGGSNNTAKEQVAKEAKEEGGSDIMAKEQATKEPPEEEGGSGTTAKEQTAKDAEMEKGGSPSLFKFPAVNTRIDRTGSFEKAVDRYFSPLPSPRRLPDSPRSSRSDNSCKHPWDTYDRTAPPCGSPEWTIWDWM